MDFFMVSFALMGVGALITMIGGIWGIVAAFREGALWGLLMLAGFISGLQLLAWGIFAMKYFDEAYPPFLTYIGGLLPLGLGIAMFFFELAIKFASA